MNKTKILKILTIIITIVSTCKIFNNVTYAESYTPGVEYACRVGDEYFRTFSDFISSQWMFQNNSETIIEILQPEIEISNRVELYIKEITFTTASSEGEYPYQGEPGTKAKFVRGENYTGQMFYFNSKDAHFGFENIIVDGGWKEDHTGIQSTAPLIGIDGQSILVLKSGAVLQNNINTGTTACAGAIYCVSGTVVAEKDTVIQNCCAAYGGGITVATGSLTTNGLTIQKCYSTNESRRNASAIEFSTYGVTFECSGLVVKECAAINATEDGAAIEMEKGNLNFIKSDDPDLKIEITNNYSNINIVTDLVIDNNYKNCTFDGFNIASTGDESNFVIDRPEKVNITTN